MDARSPNNLPEQPNPLLGRDQELKTVQEQLLSDNVRLLNVTGPPGVGKTRLAMAVAENSLEAFPQGVWFIDLAPLKDSALVMSQIASTLGIAEIRAEMALDGLVANLRDRQVLLFLDNFEGVLKAAIWVGKLLERTSEMKVLTTSRERLRLRWERMVLVRPLPLPALDLLQDPSKLAEIPSVSLFIQRAKAVNADFTLSVENAPAIAALCSRLDGLPLAIELAAAHAGVLSPEEILTNMDNRFHLLGMGAWDLPERHQTLKAAIDWSYELLPSAQGQFLRRLSVFNGGFTPAAAEVVGECEALGLDRLQGLISLAEKSLIHTVHGSAGEPRFTFLESIRDYLLDRLGTSGGLDGARRRHAEYYLELAERNYSEMKGPNQRSWLDVLEREHDNMRTALQWSLDAGEYSIGKRIAAALWSPFWWLQGHVREGLRWLETFHGIGGETHDESHLRVQEGLGTLRGWSGDYEGGKALLVEALQIAQNREDPEAIMRVLNWLTWISWINGKTEEASWLAERIEACSQDVDAWDLAYATLSLGGLLYEAGQDERAEKEFSTSLEYFEVTEEKLQGVIWARHKLALLRQQKGEFKKANEGMMEALAAAGQLNDLHVTVLCLDDAVPLVSKQIADKTSVGGSGQEKLAMVLGAVDQWREMLSLRRSPREKSAYRRVTKRLQRVMEESTYLSARQKGQSLTVERVVHEVSELLETLNKSESKESQPVEIEGKYGKLTNREHQVIGLIAEGLSNQEIGEHLFITERTVRAHVTSIYNKLGADNRAQAVAIASRLGIL